MAGETTTPGAYWDPISQKYITPSYQSGVNISSPDNQGGSITQAANPYQFATEGTAQNVAGLLGGRAYGQNIDMPGGSFSSPQQMVDVNGRTINAGLAAQTLGQYGSEPGSYGRYLVDRDTAGKPIADPWANGSDAQRGGVGNWQGVSFATDPATQARMAALTRQMYSQPPNPIRPPAGAAAPPVTSGTQAPSPVGRAGLPTGTPVSRPGPVTAPSTPTAPPPGAARPTQGSYTMTGNTTRLGSRPTQNAITPNRSGAATDGGYPASPFGPGGEGGTDPVGEARRLAAYQSAGYTQSPSGMWLAPGTPDPNVDPQGYETYLNSFDNQGSSTWDPSAYIPPSGGSTPTGTGSAPGGSTPPPSGGGGYPSGGYYSIPSGGYNSNQGFPSSGTAPSMMLQYNQNVGNGTPPDGGFNPAQQYRYGFQQQYNPATGQLGPTPPTGSAPAYPTGSYGEGFASGSSFYPSNGNDIDISAANDRNWALGVGGALQNDIRNYTQYQQGRASNYEDLANSAYNPIANGYGGYSDQEKGAILNNPYLQSLQLGADQANSNYLTGAEQSGIAGNPWQSIDQLSADEQGMDLDRNAQNQYIYDAMNGQDQQIRGAYGQSADNLRGAVGAQAQDERATLGGYANNVRGALDFGEDNARSYLDRERLGLSDRYQNLYDVNEADMQGIRNKAGRTVQSQATADEDRLNRAANAQGNTSPLALATARDRIRQTGAINSADAMSNAQIAAKQLQLGTEQNRENTRLGAEQNYANLGSGTELSLGARRTGAENVLGQSALGVANDIGTAARGAEQYLGNQRQQAEQYLGGSRLGNQQQVAGRNQSADQFKTGTNLGAFQTADQQASARAGTIAGNRQGTNQYNQGQQYARGQFIYNAGSQANTGFANTRLGQEGEYRGYLTGQGNQANQNVTIGNQQATGNLGTTAGAINGAEGNRIVNYKTPSTTEKILGGIASFAEGGAVNHGPHMALVGEAGPELIINLHRLKHDQYGERPTGPVDESGGYDPTEDDYMALQQSGADGGYDSGKAAKSGYHNPLYTAIQAKLGKYGIGQPESANPIGYGGSAPRHGGSLVGSMARKGIGSLVKLAFADGGVVAPAVEYVDKPEIRMLGGSGADAVVPMTPRPGNKVRLEDIPALAAKYGDYGGYGA